MDQARFDRLAKLLAAAGTRRAGLRAALGGIIGLGIATAETDVDARGARRDRTGGSAARRKHECGPDAPCPTGYDCVKQGRKRRCRCASGVTCGGACCAAGEACQDGACVELGT